MVGYKNAWEATRPHSAPIAILPIALPPSETIPALSRHKTPRTPTPMARLSLLCLLLLSAALAATASDDEVCSDPGYKPIKLVKGTATTKPVAGLIAQLDKRVRFEAVRHDGCRVTSTKLEKACQKVGDSTVAAAILPEPSSLAEHSPLPASSACCLPAWPADGPPASANLRSSCVRARRWTATTPRPARAAP